MSNTRIVVSDDNVEIKLTAYQSSGEAGASEQVIVVVVDPHEALWLANLLLMAGRYHLLRSGDDTGSQDQAPHKTGA